MGFPRQEYWRELPFPSPGALPEPGIEPGAPRLQADRWSRKQWLPHSRDTIALFWESISRQQSFKSLVSNHKFEQYCAGVSRQGSWAWNSWKKALKTLRVMTTVKSLHLERSKTALLCHQSTSTATCYLMKPHFFPNGNNTKLHLGKENWFWLTQTPPSPPTFAVSNM